MANTHKKRMTPEECELHFQCSPKTNGNESHPICPIADWCMAHVFEPDTCQETWKQYLAAVDRGEI